MSGRDVGECNCRNDESKAHELYCAQKDAAAPDSVDEDQIHESEDEVNCSNNGANSYGVIESDLHRNLLKVLLNWECGTLVSQHTSEKIKGL